MSEIIQQDTELNHIRLATYHEWKISKQEILKMSLISAISKNIMIINIEKILKSTLIPFRDAVTLMLGFARFYDRKVDYAVSDAADVFDGLSNVHF